MATTRSYTSTSVHSATLIDSALTDARAAIAGDDPVAYWVAHSKVEKATNGDMSKEGSEKRAQLYATLQPHNFRIIMFLLMQNRGEGVRLANPLYSDLAYKLVEWKDKSWITLATDLFTTPLAGFPQPGKDAMDYLILNLVNADGELLQWYKDTHGTPAILEQIEYYTRYQRQRLALLG